MMSKIPFTKLIAQNKSETSSDSSRADSESSRSSSKRVTHKESFADDLRKHGFEVGRVLGEGSYSKVRAAKYKGEEIACKVIIRAKLSKDFSTKFLPREIEVLSKIQHRNVIRVYKIFNFPERVYVFMERVGQGDLLNYVRSRGRLEERKARHFFRQMVSAMKYLHQLNIAHRDLKCENILIDDDDQIRIIDFGFCRSTVDNKGHRKLSETYCGSTAYAAPEVLQGNPYNPMMYDVWSLGCVLFIMVTGMMPFDDGNVRKMVINQIKKHFRFPSSVVISHPVKELIRNMLEPDVTKRITMERVARSVWLLDGEKPGEKNVEKPLMEDHAKFKVSTKATQMDPSFTASYLKKK